MTTPTLAGPLSSADAYAIINAIASPTDIATIRSFPDGAAWLALLVDQMVDLSARLDRTITARHLIARESDVSPPAAGSAYASANLTISASKSASATIVMSPTTCFAQTSDGRLFSLAAPLTWAPGAFGTKTVAFNAVLPGFGSNVIAGSIKAFQAVANGSQGDSASVAVTATGGTITRGGGDYFLRSYVGLYVTFVAGANVGKIAQITGFADTIEPHSIATITCDAPLVAETSTATWALLEWSDLGFAISQPTDATGGTDDELDALGRELNRLRQTNEGDAAYLERLTRLQRVVTPQALVAAANRALGVYGPALVYEWTGCQPDCGSSDIGLRPWPGPIFDLTPLDLPAGAAEGAPFAGVGVRQLPAGYSGFGNDGPFFMVRWDAQGLGHPGAFFNKFDLGTRPRTLDAVFDYKSPFDGRAFGDGALRAAIYDAVRTVRGFGVSWTFYPTFGPT